MADPAIIACPAETWTKIATNVTAGTAHLKTGIDQVWYQTYKATGEAAPADLSTAVKFGKDSISGETEDISASAGIDVYVYPTQKAGSIRIDL